MSFDPTPPATDPPGPSTFLTEEDLVRLTGYAQRQKQIDWLEANGWTFIVNAKAEVIVSRLHAERKLKGIAPAQMNDANVGIVLTRLTHAFRRMEEKLTALTIGNAVRKRGRPRKPKI